MSDSVTMYIDAAPVSMEIAGAQGPSLGGSASWNDLTGTANYVPFDLTPSGVPTQTGTMSWNADEGVLDLQLGGSVTLQIGSAETVEKCHNVSGSAIAEGKVVYVSGSTGDYLKIALASSASDATSKATLGLVTESGGIANGSNGFVTLRGKVRGINTNAFNAGDELWLTTSGDYTNVQPAKTTGPNHTVRIGYVVKKAGAGAGIIFVDPVIGSELGDLHDVSLGATPSNLDLLTYESSTGLWKNRTFTKSDIGLGSVENTALSTWTGSTHITTLGTIGTGTWQGTAIADLYISSASTWNAKQAALVSGTNIKTVNGNSLLGSGDLSVARAIETKTGDFTAVVGGRYIVETGGTVSVTDPTGTAAGDSYEVWIGSGNIQFNGTGTSYSASRFSIRRRYTGSAWAAPAPMLTDTLTVGSGTWSGSAFTGAQTLSGAVSFTSSTRPTSSGTGSLSSTSLPTAYDLASPAFVVLRDDFGNGSSSSGAYGELGWEFYSAGGGTGAAVGGQVATFPKVGVRPVTCGNASGASAAIYYGTMLGLQTTAGWEVTYIIQLPSTANCDMIVGFTADNAAIGLGKFGGSSFGVRYSSAVDTNFMFFSKNTNSDWATNDANNYSLSSGVAANTSDHTIGIRSTSNGAIEMRIDSGAWTAVTMVSTLARFIPFFYVSTRTTASKTLNVDFWSFISFVSR